MLLYKVDPKIKTKSITDIIDLPVMVRVNSFNETGLKQFKEDFAKALNTGQEIVPVVIDSYGGAVYSLFAMVDIIKSSPVPVATIAEGKSMSCGADLFSCGTEGLRFMHPTATLMIHDAASHSCGKVEEVKADAKETERLNQLAYKMMAKNVGKPENYFLDIIHAKGHADWYLDAEEAIKHNLANKVGVPKFKLEIKTELVFGL